MDLKHHFGESNSGNILWVHSVVSQTFADVASYLLGHFYRGKILAKTIRRFDSVPSHHFNALIYRHLR